MNDQQQSRADGLNEEQREALEWAADRAHVASLGKPVVGIESRRHRALRNLLDALAEVIPEGCTPADARMLREANHALAAENDALRCALRPFARVVSTDKLSWAMVEYCVRGDPEKQTFQAPQMQRAFNRAADILRAESSQPAAPPIVSAPASDARECYSVQEHVDAMCQVIDECADFFHDFVGADEGGNDEAVRIAKNIRALKAGTLQDVSAPADAGEARLTDAARDMLAERRRQVEAEGWTPEHDDQYQHGAIALAAACYAANAGGVAWADPLPSFWPWMHNWWKPTTPRRDLVKAGALILAELERLDRAALLNGADHDQ